MFSCADLLEELGAREGEIANAVPLSFTTDEKSKTVSSEM